MITGFCSLINGGYYYEPHMVSKITAADGSVVKNIEPRLLKADHFCGNFGENP